MSEMERIATEEAEELGTQELMRELAMDAEKFPAEAVEGTWI